MSESEPNPQAVPEPSPASSAADGSVSAASAPSTDTSASKAESTPAEGATKSAEAATSSEPVATAEPAVAPETASAQATTTAAPAPDAPPAPAAAGGQGGAVPPAPGQFAPAPPAPGVPVGMSAPAVASAPGVPAMAPGAMAAQPGMIPQPGMAPQGAVRPVNPRTAARNAYITQCFRLPGIITWVVGLVITLVVAFIVGAIANSVLTDLAGGFMSRDDAPSLLGPLAGMALGGKADLTASYSSMRAGGAGLRILPSIGHLVIFIAIALLAKFRRAGEIIPVDIAAVAARAGIEAFGVAVVSMVVFLIAAVDSEGAHIAADPFAVFFNTLVLVFLALVVGRFATYKHLLVTGRSSIAYQGIFDAVVIFVVSIAVCFLFGAIVLMLKDAKPALALAMPLNLGVVGAGVAALGYIDRGLNGSGKWGGSSHGLGDMSAFDGGAISLMLVALVVMFILAAVAVAVLRRPNYGPVRWLYIAYAAPTALVLWGYSIYAYARFSLNMDALGYGGKGNVGLSPVTVLNLVIYTALVSLAAEFAPRYLRNLRFRPVLVPVAGAAAMAAGTTPTVAVPGAVPAVPGAVPVAGSAPVVTGSMPAVAPSAATGSVPVTNPAAVAMPTANVASDQQLPLTGSAGVASGATAYSAPGVASAPASGQMNPYTTTYPRAPRKPLSKNAKISLAAVLAVVLVVIIGVVGVNVINSGRNAEEVVRNYAQLIADGKYDEANKVVDPGVGKSKRMLLTNKAYTGAKKAVKVVSVTQREADEDTPNKAIVDVVMSINGESTTYSLGVKQGDKEYGLLKTWKIVTPMVKQEVTLPVAPALKTFKIGSVTLPAPQDVSQLESYPIYPGVYSIEGQARSPQYLKVGLSEKYFSIYFYNNGKYTKYLKNTAADIKVVAEGTDNLKKWALEKAVEKVKACGSMSGGTNMDGACPYQVRETDLQVLQVKTLPTKLDQFDVHAQSGEVEVGATGALTFKAKEGAYFFRDSKLEDVDCGLSGTISFTNAGQPMIAWR